MSFKCRVAIALLGMVPVLGIAQTSQQTGSSTSRPSGSQVESDPAGRGTQTSPPSSGATGAGQTQSPGSMGTRTQSPDPQMGTRPSATSQVQSGGMDQAFVTKAATGGMAEVELAKLAQQKAANKEVKDLAAKIVTDHTRANEELQGIARSLNITVPKTVDTKEKDTKDRLSKLSGAEFDRSFVNQIVSDHREHIAEFKKVASSGNNQRVKDFASKTLPTLEEHLRLAEAAMKTVGGSQVQGLQEGSGSQMSTPGSGRSSDYGSGSGTTTQPSQPGASGSGGYGSGSSTGSSGTTTPNQSGSDKNADPN